MPETTPRPSREYINKHENDEKNSRRFINWALILSYAKRSNDPRKVSLTKVFGEL